MAGEGKEDGEHTNMEAEKEATKKSGGQGAKG